MGRAIVNILIVLVLAAPLSAQPAPAAAEEASLLTEFERDYKTLLVISDPLPHVQRALGSPQLARVWNTGQLIAYIRKTNPRAVIPAPQAVSFLILQNHRWVPSEIALGLHDSAMGDFDHLIRTMLLSSLVDAADTAEDEKALAALRGQLAGELRELRLPPMRLWVRFRDEQDARSLLELISEQVQELVENEVLPVPLDVHAEENALRVSVSIADAFADRDERLEILQDMNWTGGEDDPNAAAMEQAFARLRADVAIELHGSGLRVTIGQSPAGQPLTVADLGPLHKADDEQTMLFATWDITRLITACEGWVKLIDQWKDTPVGEAFAEEDEDDFAGDLRMLSRQLKGIGAAGSTRVWGAQSTVDFEMQELGVPPAPPLARSPLLRLIPADASSFMADTISTLSERVSNSISEAEGRLAMRSLQADLGARTPRALQAARMTEIYYEHFAPLRQFIHHESQQWFAAGCAFVFGGQGTVRKIEFMSPQVADLSFGLNDLPVPEFAALGVVNERQPQGQYVRHLYEMIIEGALAAQGEENPKAQASVVEADLGLGVKTWALTAPWLAQLESVRVQIEGDVRPHYFVHDGVLVFSTSPRLSKRMLDAARGGKSTTLPAPRQQGQLVQVGRFEGRLFADFLNQFAAWMEQISTMEAKAAQAAKVRPKAQARDPKEFFAVLRGMGEFVALMDAAQWQAYQQGSTRDTRGDISFVK